MLNKTFRASIKSIDADQGKLTFLASTYEIDDQGDQVMPGAYKATIAKAKAKGSPVLWPLLWAHDMAAPIGGVTSAREVPGQGLVCEGQLVLTVPKAQQAMDLIKANAVTGFSIGFTLPANSASYRASDGVRELKEIELGEISLVSIPANSGAQLISAKHGGRMNYKSMLEQSLRDHISRLRKAKDLNEVMAAAQELEDLLFLGRVPRTAEEDLRSTMLTADGSPAVPTYAGYDTPGKGRLASYYSQFSGSRQGRVNSLQRGSTSSNGHHAGPRELSEADMNNIMGKLRAMRIKTEGEW